jgi:hypothetical protein
MSPRVRAFGLVQACVALLAAAAPLAARQSVPPVLGRSLEVTLFGGGRVAGELIEVTDRGLLLLPPSGLLLATPLADVTRVRVRRHDFTGRRVFLWSAVGALVSGLGLTVACSQVEGADCGGVLPGMAVSWTLVGGLLGLAITGSAWQEVPPLHDTLLPYSRFPQGAPPGFGGESAPNSSAQATAPRAAPARTPRSR